MPRLRKPASPFNYFNSSPEVTRLVAMMYFRVPLNLGNFGKLLAERGIDICHETARCGETSLARCTAAPLPKFAGSDAAGVLPTMERHRRSFTLMAAFAFVLAQTCRSAIGPGTAPAQLYLQWGG